MDLNMLVHIVGVGIGLVWLVWIGYTLNKESKRIENDKDGIDISLSQEEIDQIVMSLNADILLVNAFPKQDEETTLALKKRIRLDMELIRKLNEETEI